MSIPNRITCFRILLVPVFLATYFSSIENNFFYAIIIFIFAGITDVLDGYIARKYHIITKLGQVLDPLADKLMQMTVLFCLTTSKLIPIWIIFIYSIKEFIMICGSIYLYFKKENLVIPSNRYGKIATFMFYLAVILVVLPYGKYFFFIMLFFTILALIQYLIIVKHKLEQSNPLEKST